MSVHRIPKLAAAIALTIGALAGGSVLAGSAHPASSQGLLCAAVAPAPDTGRACPSTNTHASGCQANLTMALVPVSDGSPPPPGSTPDCPIPNPG
jgi:hypothetical protein